MTRRAPHSPKGLSIIEILVVVVIFIVLSSLVIPALAKARFESRKTQCASNLRQIGQALIMYQAFEGRAQNAFPERLTHLADPAHQYISDTRLFICPMDIGHATETSLKPGNPSDNKASWAERNNSPAADAGYYVNGLPLVDTRKQLNCSYLYEFSTRQVQTYYLQDNPDGDANTWTTDDWASEFLVQWDLSDPTNPTPCNDYSGNYSFSSFDVTPTPSLMSRFSLTNSDGSQGIITWQEAKFSQLENGDVCNTGLVYPTDGNPAYPGTWFNIYDQDGFQMDPADMINFGFADASDNTVYSSPQHGYGGSWLPIVRCFWHQTPTMVDTETVEEVLNLAVDGNTFYSAPGWEQTAWNYGRDGDMPDGP